MVIIPSIVIAEFSNNEGTLGDGQDLMCNGIGRQCTKFIVHTMYRFKTLRLRTQDIAVPKLNSSQTSLIKNKFLFQQFTISVNLVDCKLVFEFDKNLKKCQYSPAILHDDGVNCDLNTYSIL